jgi:hypothetical protein
MKILGIDPGSKGACVQIDCETLIYYILYFPELVRIYLAEPKTTYQTLKIYSTHQTLY